MKLIASYLHTYIIMTTTFIPSFRTITTITHWHIYIPRLITYCSPLLPFLGYYMQLLHQRFLFIFLHFTDLEPFHMLRFLIASCVFFLFLCLKFYHFLRWFNYHKVELILALLFSFSEMYFWYWTCLSDQYFPSMISPAFPLSLLYDLSLSLLLPPICISFQAIRLFYYCVLCYSSSYSHCIKWMSFSLFILSHVFYFIGVHDFYVFCFLFVTPSLFFFRSSCYML